DHRDQRSPGAAPQRPLGPRADCREARLVARAHAQKRHADRRDDAVAHPKHGVGCASGRRQCAFDDRELNPERDRVHDVPEQEIGAAKQRRVPAFCRQRARVGDIRDHLVARHGHLQALTLKHKVDEQSTNVKANACGKCREGREARLARKDRSLKLIARESTVFVAGARAANDRRAHQDPWVRERRKEKGGRFRVPLFGLYIATGGATFLAVLRFAALRTGFLAALRTVLRAVFLAAFFAGFLAVLRFMVLRTDFFATFFAGFLAAAFLTFLAIVISSLGFVWSWLDGSCLTLRRFFSPNLVCK